MSQLIITTDLKGIRPVFDNTETENIKRYQQLKKIFEKDKEYRIFAEPIISTKNKIAWHTEYKGIIQLYTKLDDEEKQQINARLKEKVNSLYKNILKLFNTSEERYKMFEFLDYCFEIPDYSDIFIIYAPNGERNFTLTRWGFMPEKTNKRLRILSSLIPLKVNTLYVNVIVGNNKLAVGKEIFIKINNKEKKYITDKDGKIVLEDYPLLATFQIYVKEDGEAKYLKEFVVNYNQTITYYIGSDNIERQKVYIQAVDGDNKPQINETLRIRYEDIQKDYETDQDGKIFLGELFVDTNIEIAQISENEIIKLNNFIVEKGKEIYRFITQKTKKYGLLKIKALDENGDVLSNLDIEVLIGDKKYRYKTDNNGIIEIPNVPLKSDVKVRQIVDGIPTFQQRVKYNAEKELYIFRGKRLDTDKRFATFVIKVVDKNNNSVPNLRVEIETYDQIYAKITDNIGIARFEKVNCTHPIRLKIEHKGRGINQEIECKEKENNITIILDNKTFLWWILGAIGLLILLLLFLLQGGGKSNKQVDNQLVIDTIKPHVVVPDGFKLTIYKDTLKQPAVNAMVIIRVKDTSYRYFTDSTGKIIVPELQDYQGNIDVQVNAKGYPEQLFSFSYQREKILYLTKEEGDITELILPCDTTILSRGYHSTIKVFKLTKQEGFLTFLYGTYQIPDKFIIYRGTIKDTSAKNIIWQSPFQSGDHKRIFRFQAPDSLITVRVIGGDTVKTKWYFRVNCP